MTNEQWEERKNWCERHGLAAIPTGWTEAKFREHVEALDEQAATYQRVFEERWRQETQALLDAGIELYPPPPSVQEMPERLVIVGRLDHPRHPAGICEVKGWETREVESRPSWDELTRKWATA